MSAKGSLADRPVAASPARAAGAAELADGLMRADMLPRDHSDAGKMGVLTARGKASGNVLSAVCNAATPQGSRGTIRLVKSKQYTHYLDAFVSDHPNAFVARIVGKQNGYGTAGGA